MHGLQDALIAIKGGRIPPPSSLPSFEEIKYTLGFNHYYEEEKQYVVTPAQSSYRTGMDLKTCSTLIMNESFLTGSSSITGYGDYTSEPSSPGYSSSTTGKTQEPVIDILPQLYDIGSSGGRGPSTGMWSRTLRLKITGRDGIQKIDARIPVSNP